MNITLAAGRLAPRRIIAFALAFAALAASSRIAVPLGPVPMTMQTLAVTLAGAALGPRAGAAVVAAWVAAGFAGLPVLALGNAGVAAMTGPTAGYLYAFPAAAAATGLAAGRGAGFPRLLAAMLLGNALCLALGAAWLAPALGPAGAFAAGAAPFIAGGVLKSLLGALILAGARRAR